MDTDSNVKKRARAANPWKRAQSLSPIARQNSNTKKKEVQRRALSVSKVPSRKSLHSEVAPQPSVSTPDHIGQDYRPPDTEVILPQNVIAKMTRTFATKKREFMKMRKHFILQQNSLLEHFASLKDLEARIGISSESLESLGDLKVVVLSKWPGHDLLMLIRDDLPPIQNSDIKGVIGPQIIQQLNAQLNIIPEEVIALGAELMARRLGVLNTLRSKHRTDRASYQANLEWKAKNVDLDHETEQLHMMIASTAENLRTKINFAMELAKTPWIDRDNLIKKMEHLQREVVILQQKYEEAKKDNCNDSTVPPSEGPRNQALVEELSRERAARESLKEVVSGAEAMLRVARGRIANLERSLKDTRADLESTRRKHHDLEQLYRHRESSFDARSKKLLEVSKTGEVTIEALSRQRDALELRVKELRDQVEASEKVLELREVDLKSRADTLQCKVIEQENARIAAEEKVVMLEARLKEANENHQLLKEKSMRLLDAQQRHYVDFVPVKEPEPTDRETELWKELQVTRGALSRAEEELRQSRADKDTFLNSLSRLAQDGVDPIEDKMALELLDREQKISKLQNIIEEQRENEKLMEQSMTQYENQLADLRLEVKKLRNYDCYTKEVIYQDLQTELLELHMKVATLSRERSTLMSAAASRSLMLERHERAADLFSRVTRLRRELSSYVEEQPDPQVIEETSLTEVSRSLSSMCASAAETWSALRLERARVLRLERAVLAQSAQLEREGRARTQLERRRAYLERQMLRGNGSSESSILKNSPSIICYIMVSKSVGSNKSNVFRSPLRSLYGLHGSSNKRNIYKDGDSVYENIT